MEPAGVQRPQVFHVHVFEAGIYQDERGLLSSPQGASAWHCNGDATSTLPGARGGAVIASAWEGSKKELCCQGNFNPLLQPAGSRPL